MILTIVAALTYFYSFGHGFLWDDEVLILQNPLIRSFSWTGQIFASGFWAGEGDYYRPLSIFTYLIDYSISGLNPWVYHLSNLVYHLIATFGFYFALVSHFQRRTAFWAAALFCVHPVGAANVFPIFGRCGILEGVLFFGLAFFARSNEKWIYRVLVIFIFFLGLLSKESALVFPAIVTLYYFTIIPRNRDRKKMARLLLVLWAMAAVYLGARFYWHPFKTHGTLSLIATAPLFERIWTSFEVILRYFEVLLFPAQLHTERHFISKIAEPWIAPLPWMGILSVLAALGFGWRYRKQRPHFLFGTLWFLIWLSPTANLIPLPMTMAEHWLYLPMGGILWILADGIEREFQKKVSEKKQLLLSVFLGSAVLLYSTRTIFRGFDWKDGATLYSHDLVYSPNSFLLHTNYGSTLFREGKFDVAKKEFLAAIEINSRYGMAWNNLGAVFQREGDTEKAIKCYEHAVQLSGDALGFENLAGVLLMIGRDTEAKKWLKQGIQLHPSSEGLRQMLSLVRPQA